MRWWMESKYVHRLGEGEEAENGEKITIYTT